MARTILSLAFVGLISGCATSSEYTRTGAALYAWENSRSAALVVADGDNKVRACTQFAMVENSYSADAKLKISDALLKAASAIHGVGTGTGTPNKDDAEATASAMSATIQKLGNALNTTTERTSFLMVGGFYICQLQANGLEAAKVHLLATELIKTAGTLQPTRTQYVQRPVAGSNGSGEADDSPPKTEGSEPKQPNTTAK
ncbi:hypothetical protein [Cupriavidus sp. USMAA2-4]|uniref:hypothetical protein n=1 Tax=Cupriavidus sp. USMAA2-4 TaxID=876364 RepID=UPI0012F4797B|nr:hypothetical protein [Cupriavidus sp. USMAA2-4]